MKKKILFCLICFFLFTGFVSAQFPYSVRGNLKDNQDSTYFHIVNTTIPDTSKAYSFMYYHTCMIDWTTTSADSCNVQIVLAYSIDAINWTLSDSTIAITTTAYGTDTLHVNFPAPYIKFMIRALAANKKATGTSPGSRMNFNYFFKQ